ncbi:CRAL/TRIO domain protein [Dictyocaulus viviparus]|uniref:CRAL/TRIO domain protein n=1 Tax=Dictyocaulus viviparus TaxID=29172 RepID=A0A0D8Y5P6_DICVI|nr:CRAL/TRIO domain protein [Dictyocaulus viviparus]
MPPTVEAEFDANVIEQVRTQVSDILHPRYDTYFNILRWLKSYEFNVSKTVYNLRKHLKFRKERHLDEDARGLQRSAVAAEYAPISIVGPNRKGGDRLIVVDQCGKVDIGGLMKSIQPTEYLHQLYRNFEKILSLMMEMEAKTGVQCYVYYIFDLDGLSFDPTLLGVINGPFRVSWQLIGQHYREVIGRFITVNTPSYINVLWSALSPFVPENEKSRIALTGKNWKEEILEVADAECLPEKYGGKLCDDKIMRNPKPVPKGIYWRPRTGYPSLAAMHRISIPAAKTRTLIYHVQANTDLLFYSQNDSDITFSFYYSENENIPEDECEVLVPPVQKCGLPAMDLYDMRAERTGYYYLKLANDAAWLFPTTYKLIVHDKSGGEIKAINQDEKWIKHGVKSK